MPDRVFYHHPVDRQFSLDYVNPDAERVGERVADYEPSTSVKVREYDLDRSVYVVYTNSGADGAADELDIQVADRVEALDDPNAVIAARYIRIFKNVLERNYEEEGERVQAYKNVDPEAIGRALEQTDWDGSAVEVAGRLASNLILKHPLPNANHRTAIGMIELYLSRLEPAFTMPATARELEDEYAWMEWVNEYIEQSKRLLTVRRKGDKFQYLSQWGCDVLERKHDVEIWLDDYDLDLAPSERWTQYAREHEQLWIEFVEEAVQKTDIDRLEDTSALSRHEFEQELSDVGT